MMSKRSATREINWSGECRKARPWCEFQRASPRRTIDTASASSMRRTRAPDNPWYCSSSSRTRRTPSINACWNSRCGNAIASPWCACRSRKFTRGSPSTRTTVASRSTAAEKSRWCTSERDTPPPTTRRDTTRLPRTARASSGWPASDWRGGSRPSARAWGTTSRARRRCSRSWRGRARWSVSFLRRRATRRREFGRPSPVCTASATTRTGRTWRR
mmetsp:Transcript_3356/g.5015  ORF Transcript_3356/g.5015 Transcript_3356/m.5015 type:complete len:216 (+) Transcript_3356:845-1492(+)